MNSTTLSEAFNSTGCWVGGISYVVQISLIRNKSPSWLQVSPMKLVPIKALTLTKECVIFLLQPCVRKSTSSLDTSGKEIISQKNKNIFKLIYELLFASECQALESTWRWFFFSIVDKCFTIMIKSTEHEWTSETLDIYWTETTLHIHFSNDIRLSHILMYLNCMF